MLITCIIRSLWKVPFEKKNTRYRKLKSIVVSEMRAGINISSLVTEEADDVTVLVDQYNSVLSSPLDMHAPLRERVVTLRPAAPWHTENIKVEKRM